MNLSAADFVEEIKDPEYVQPEVQEELDPQANYVEEDPAQLQEQFLKTIIEDFGPEQHENLIKVLTAVESFAGDALNKARAAMVSTEAVKYSDVSIDYQNQAYTDYVKNIAIVGLLHGAGKLDDALVNRFQVARTNLYRAELYAHGVAEITQEELTDTINELDQRLLQGVYGMMMFQLEQVVRTLRQYKLMGQLSKETYDIYTERASDIFNKHMDYATFNELDTEVLKTTYDIVSEIITEYAGLLDRD